MPTNRHYILLTTLLFVLFFASCKKDKDLTVDTTLLPGVWQIDGTEQFLHFKDDNTGAFWDESEDVYEDDIETDGNGYFVWALTGVHLQVNFTISVSGGSVPKTSTITRLNGTKMTLQDTFKNNMTLTRKKEVQVDE